MNLMHAIRKFSAHVWQSYVELCAVQYRCN